jgi:opioid growth factor receptor-like protein
VAESAVVAFYRGNGRDHRGRSLSDIHGFDFYELEFNHDYIQWLFPLPEPSGASASAPILSDDDIARFQFDESLRERLLQSFELMLRFFGLELARAGDVGAISVGKARHFDERHKVWLNPGNHNFLRISRILRSLTLLGCSSYASVFLECLEEMYVENPKAIGDTTLGYWRRAVTAKV